MNVSQRSHKEDLNEPFMIFADPGGLPLMANLLRIENNMARFAVDGNLNTNDTVTACPREKDTIDDIPSIDYIQNHPNRLTGKIIQVDTGKIYTVRIAVQIGAKKSYTHLSASSIQVNEEKPYCIIISQSGTPDLRKFVRFHDIIQEQSVRNMNLLIDLSGIDKFPPTASAIFSDLLDSLSRRKRRTALVKAEVLGDLVMKEHAQNPQIHLFANQEDALRYFQEHPITILIVEDDITTLEIIKSVIKKQKFLPIPMSNGEDTLQFVESNTPDLILMDINLPGISGIETIRTIREQKQLKNVPIILLTAESSRDTVEAGLKLHVCGYILKPLKSNRLIQKIFSAITN